MSEEEKYVTARIPKFFNDLIKKYIETHQEEMRFLGQRLSRAGVIKRALYEFFKKEGMIPSRSIQEDTFRLHIMEVFRTLYSVLDKTEMNRESRQETREKSENTFMNRRRNGEKS